MKYIAICLLSGLFLIGCSEELIIKRGVTCSDDVTYCEDIKYTEASSTVYENITPMSDSRDITGNTIYEELLP